MAKAKMDDPLAGDDPFAVPAEETEEPAKPKRKRRSATSRGDLRDRLDQGIAQLAETVRHRDPELADILAEDGPLMAELLSRWASHRRCPPPLRAAITIAATALEPLRAFGRLARLLIRRLAERRARRAEEENLYEETPYEEAETPPGVEVEPPAGA